MGKKHGRGVGLQNEQVRRPCCMVEGCQEQAWGRETGAGWGRVKGRLRVWQARVVGTW